MSNRDPCHHVNRASVVESCRERRSMEINKILCQRNLWMEVLTCCTISQSCSGSQQWGTLVANLPSRHFCKGSFDLCISALCLPPIRWQDNREESSTYFQFLCQLVLFFYCALVCNGNPSYCCQTPCRNDLTNHPEKWALSTCCNVTMCQPCHDRSSCTRCAEGTIGQN